MRNKVTTEPNDPLYFAYGSNLDFDDLERRSPGLAALLEPVEPAYLPDRELAFTRRSVMRNGGVLDVRPRRGALVHGMLFRVHGDGWDRLDEKEGARGGRPAYRRVHGVAFVGEREERILTYEVVDRATHVQPGSEYLGVVRKGRERWAIDVGELERAAAGQPGVVLDSLFVYGTLMRDESHFPLLCPEQLTCLLLAETRGELVDHGAFPGLRPNAGSQRLVQGELTRHRDIETVLTQLDEIEGFRGWSDSGSLFRRAVIDVGMGDGRVRRAWTYVSCIDSGKPIASGDWRAHRKDRGRFLEALVRVHCGSREHDFAARLASLGGVVDEAHARLIASSLLPLASALARGDVSERQLAQLSENWVAIP